MIQYSLFKGIGRITDNTSDLDNSIRAYTYKFDLSIGPGTQSSFGVTGLPDPDAGGRIIFPVVGWIDDEQFTESVDGEWTRLVDSGGGLLQEVNKVMSVFGKSIVTKWMHNKVWTDSKSPTFAVNLKLVAENDAFEEVWRPARMMQALCVPGITSNSAATENSGIFKPIIETLNRLQAGTGGGFLDPPQSPESGIQLRGLHVGRMFKLNDIIITGVDVDWSIQDVDKDGYPMSANVKVEFESSSLWDKTNIQSLIGTRGMSYVERKDSSTLMTAAEKLKTIGENFSAMISQTRSANGLNQ